MHGVLSTGGALLDLARGLPLPLHDDRLLGLLIYELWHPELLLVFIWSCLKAAGRGGRLNLALPCILSRL